MHSRNNYNYYLDELTRLMSDVLLIIIEVCNNIAVHVLLRVHCFITRFPGGILL